MREPKLGVACGKKGVGKTYTTTKMIESYVKGDKKAGIKPRRVLILDVNDEFEQYRAMSLLDVPLFSVHPKIEVRRIRPFNDDGRRMTLNEIADCLFFILENYRSGLLLIEDINRYVSDNLPNDIVGAICTNRHTDTDIIMHFQSIGRISPKIWQNMNWLRFHKNSDSVERHKNKFPDKVALLQIVENLVTKEYYGDNPRYYVYVDLDTETIKGKYTEKMLKDAIDSYVSMNYNQAVKPYINKRDDKGKKLYTPERAIKEVKATLYRSLKG